MTSRWRLGRSWSADALRSYLAELQEARPNFDELPERMTPDHGWTVDGDDRVIGHEAPGPPSEDGLFARACHALVTYRFSDPRIVTAHFDPDAPLLGRDMLLEMRVLGIRFLCGCRVSAVRDESDDRRTCFGYRYDTLAGHVEQGFEWFLLSKDHASGEVRFRIQAHWRVGDFPGWWSRLGFLLIGERYRTHWRRQAFRRLRRLAQ